MVRNQLGRNHVRVVDGAARFIDPHTVGVRGEDGEERRLSASRILIAVGTRPARPSSVEFDGRTILDSDDILNLDWIPSSLVVVGAGVIGIEYASMFAAVGTKVTVIEQRDAAAASSATREVVEALQYHLRDTGVDFRFGERVSASRSTRRGAITIWPAASGCRATPCSTRPAARAPIDGLQLGAGRARGGHPRPDHRQPQLSHTVRHIYAAGDVIGFPAWPPARWSRAGWPRSTPSGCKTIASAAPMPIGIYTIPEISYVGKTEEELTAAAIPYEIGVSRYKELARGQIVGDSHGMLKLLVSPDDSSLLGVHVFGTGATELVHIGQMLMTTGGTVDHLVDAVFNYPTLAESYKVAALDAMNRVQALRRLAS